MDFEEGGKVDNLKYITDNKISVNEVKLGTIMLLWSVRLAGCVCGLRHILHDVHSHHGNWRPVDEIIHHSMDHLCQPFLWVCRCR